MGAKGTFEGGWWAEILWCEDGRTGGGDGCVVMRMVSEGMRVRRVRRFWGKEGKGRAGGVMRDEG